jgi:phosphoribosylanthranilate isomerase
MPLFPLPVSGSARQSAPLVKICGFTRAVDVDAAIADGVDAIGLNLAKGPRKITADIAATFAQRCPASVTPVLLTVDADLATCLELLRQTGCQAIQLHGRESAELSIDLRRRVPVIKAFAIATASDLAAVRGFPADAYLLDAKVQGLDGGSGQAWDWSLLTQDLGAPIMLAGGLNAGNVGEAIARVHPWAVDTASGVEAAPGIKDAAAMAAFIGAAKS